MGKRSDFVRRPSNKYFTPFSCVTPLLQYLDPCVFVEPCAGDGRLVRHLERIGFRCVQSFDLEPDSLFVGYGDALETRFAARTIITNPPWERCYMHPMIERFVHDADQAWLLFDADWPHTRQSEPFMKWCSDIVPIGRVKWIEDSKYSGKDNVCWYRFSRDATRTVFHPVGVAKDKRPG